MIITHDLLVQRNACRDQRNDFLRLFPNGVTVTRELCVKYAEVFDWNWAASKLLKTLAARESWDRAVDAAAKVYEERIASSEKAYIVIHDGVRGRPTEELMKASAAYSEALDSARAVELESVALAFARSAEIEDAAQAEEIFQNVDNWAEGTGQ